MHYLIYHTCIVGEAGGINYLLYYISIVGPEGGEG